MTRRWVTTREAVAWAFAAIGVISLIGALLFGLASQASITSQIQQERARNVRDACVGQNKRHDDTLHGIDLLTLKRVAGPRAILNVPPGQVKVRLEAVLAQVPAAQRKQIEQSLSGTAYIIDRLAPKQDCVARVKSQVGQ